MNWCNVLERNEYLSEIARSWDLFPVVALLGPRQVGKTTLARQYGKLDFGGAIPPTHYFDLEDPVSEARLAHPKLALEQLTGLIIIDEIQRLPTLFPVLRVLADAKKKDTRFLILGSASLDLVKNSSETLAGRIRFFEIHPFSLHETGENEGNKLWLRGGFPPAFLAQSDADSALWREQYIRTFLERDIPQLGINIPAQAMRRLWQMLTHVHGNILNLSELGRSLDLSDATVRRYIDILAGTFMVRRLTAWHANVSKRQVKLPKVFIRDSGILHQLSGIGSWQTLQTHPRLGASWEGYALEEVVRKKQLRNEELYFWAVHEQAELDLLSTADGKMVGYEFKYTDKPQLTKSMLTAYSLLKLNALYVVYPGNVSFKLSPGIEAIPLPEVAL
jgi:predicted AAA+ superfamily ATPase